MLNRSTREAGNCKFNRRILLLFFLSVTGAFRTNADQFYLILDPYFYSSHIQAERTKILNFKNQIRPTGAKSESLGPEA